MLVFKHTITFTIFHSDIYLIYARLLVYVTLNLTYSKEYVYYILLIYSITLFSKIFYIFLYDICVMNLNL